MGADAVRRLAQSLKRSRIARRSPPVDPLEDYGHQRRLQEVGKMVLLFPPMDVRGVDPIERPILQTCLMLNADALVSRHGVCFVLESLRWVTVAVDLCSLTGRWRARWRRRCDGCCRWFGTRRLRAPRCVLCIARGQRQICRCENNSSQPHRFIVCCENATVRARTIEKNFMAISRGRRADAQAGASIRSFAARRHRGRRSASMHSIAMDRRWIAGVDAVVIEEVSPWESRLAQRIWS